MTLIQEEYRWVCDICGKWADYHVGLGDAHEWYCQDHWCWGDDNVIIKMREGYLMKYKIQVCKGKKQWYWILKHKNGHTLAHSEQYSSRYKAKQTASTLYESFKRGCCALELDNGEAAI